MFSFIRPCFSPYGVVGDREESRKLAEKSEQIICESMKKGVT
jgi:hypothetical protein